MLENVGNSLQISVPPLEGSMRLDAFLVRQLPDFSRSRIQALIKEKLVTLNGQSPKVSQAVSAHDIIAIAWPKPKALELSPYAFPLDILFNDEQVLVINKPQGLTVHPGAGNFDQTLCNALIHHFPDMKTGDADRPGIVHRLDKNTSGVMIVAKSPQAHQILSDDFKHRRIKKTYSVLCYGEIEQQRFTLKTGHMRHPHQRMRFFTGIPAPKGSITGVRLAHTSFEIEARRYGLSLLSADLHSGRTHQIRAHLADIGHPLLGDKLYGPARSLKRGAPPELSEAISALKGQALHAKSIEFAHPLSKERLTFTAPLPADLETIARFFKND